MLTSPLPARPVPRHLLGVIAALLALLPSRLPAQLDMSRRDSVKAAIVAGLPPRDAADAWLLLGRMYRRINADSTTWCYEQALSLYRSLDYAPGIEAVYSLMSYHQTKQGNYALSNQYAFEALRIGRAMDSLARVNTVLIQIGINYLQLGLPDSAQRYYIEALRIAEARQNPEQQIFALVNIGNIYYEARHFSEALPWYQRAEALSRQTGDDRNRGMTLISLGRTIYDIDSTRLDTALSYSREGLRLLAQFRNLEEYTFYGFLNLMEFEARKGNAQASEQAFEQAGAIAEAQQSDDKRAGITYIRAVALQALGKPAAAAEAYSRAYALSRQISNRLTMQACAHGAATLYAEIGNWKAAYGWTEIYHQLRDSIGNETMLSRLNELNIQYETEKKDKDLAQKSLEISRQQGRVRLMGGMVVLLLIGLGGGGAIYRQRQALAARQIQAMEQEKEISRIRAMVMGEEKERTRIAKDLHDGLGGLLSAAKLQFSALPERMRGLDDQPAFEQGMEILDTVSREARRIAHNLMPDMLLRLGLAGALEAFCQQISESRALRVDFEYAGPDGRLPAPLELSVYRIVQELINNILKHAGATEALVQVLRDERVLSITVEDNGQGFAASQEANGMGLDSIQSRLAFLGGKMDVQSEPGRGASVFVEIILNK